MSGRQHLEITVLHTADCPGVQPLVADLIELAGDRSDVTLTTRLVATPAEAAALGFHGSPTILIDGRDPFPFTDEPGALACRLYPCNGAEPRGRPSRKSLEAALAQAIDPAQRAAVSGSTTPVATKAS